MPDVQPKKNLAKVIPYILIICGAIILVASLLLSIDNIKILQNPSYKPICDLNPVVSCGDVIQAKQGKAFGFPNPYIGLFAGGVLMTTGAAMFAGGKFKRWYWLGMELGTLFGMGFIGWLFYQSLYDIHDLCPYCLTVWVATIITFWYVTLFNIDQKNIILPTYLNKPYTWIRKHHADIIVLFFILLAAFILHHFWYYYGKHL
jgi:uncharacterized membrane protein